MFLKKYILKNSADDKKKKQEKLLRMQAVKNVVITLCMLGTHPRSGSDRTIASVRQATALAMLYIGRLVTCGIDYSFTQ